MSGGAAFFSPGSSSRLFGSLRLPSGRHSNDVHHSVEVGSEPTPIIPLALDELDETLLFKQVEVTLDGPRTSGEPIGQGLHTRPAQAGLVI